ncbi:hypothetical protein GW17_00013129 [Ensete ventricosum]|nr:hypothetical protein GW17_00013129 [Ensete ventricosum]
MARGRPAGSDGVQARTTRGISSPLLLLSSFPLLLLLLLLLPFFSLNRPSTVEIDRDGRFWRYHPVAGSSHTGNLATGWYHVPVGLINLEDEDFGKNIVDDLHWKLQEALSSENCDKIRILMRFLTVMVCYQALPFPFFCLVVDNSSVICICSC